MPFAVTAEDDPDDFIVSTYFSLRLGLTLVAVFLPPALYIWGRAHGVPLQYSMSAYSHADAAGLSCPGGHRVVRDLFVGGLFAVAALPARCSTVVARDLTARGLRPRPRCSATTRGG